LHHIHHWLDGGDTALENMVLLCQHHHLVIHHDHWQLEMIDGLPWFTPPPWFDPNAADLGTFPSSVSNFRSSNKSVLSVGESTPDPGEDLVQ
jgi:hypothetical protein